VKTGLLAATLAVLIAGASARAAGPEPKSDDEKTIYAIGLALSQNLAPFSLSEKELELVKAGLTDGVLGKERKVDLQTFGPKINQLAQARSASAASAEKKSSETFLAKAAGEKGAQKTASGLVYTEVKAGSGESPKPSDTVKVHYTGKLTDGTVFDSSVQRGEPATFPLNGVIKCWTEGLQLMKVGGKGTLVCPSDIAYGDQGRPPQIKPGATLVFDVELLDIVKQK
jgi:FKBP-type peptidyl-prolyl cis-trans isomerase FkpA